MIDDLDRRLPIPGLQEVGGEDEQSLGKQLECPDDGSGDLEGRLVVSLLGFRTGEAESRGRVHWIELEGPAEQPDRELRLSLGDVHFRERQVRADQAGLQANGFLEQAGALIEPLLLKSDGAQHGMGGAARLRVRQRELCLRLGLFEAALLHQVRRALQRLAAVARALVRVERMWSRSAAGQQRAGRQRMGQGRRSGAHRTGSRPRPGGLSLSLLCGLRGTAEGFQYPVASFQSGFDSGSILATGN